MTHLKTTLFLSLILSTSCFSYASVSCDKIIENLKQMKKAQVVIQDSLISNHNMMADSLDSYSDALGISGGKAYKTIKSNMSVSANSYRKRGQKAQELADKLADQTEELIKEVQNCLK